MGLLLGFAPLIVFSILTGLSVDLALWASFAVAFVLAIRDFAQTRILRSLDVGSTLLFGLLAIYTGFIQPSLSVQAVRLVVDGGFLVVCGASVLGGTPFTLAYVREQVSKELRRTRDFLRSHQIVSAAWLLAFAAMSAVDAAATFQLKKFPVTLDGAAKPCGLDARSDLHGAPPRRAGTAACPDKKTAADAASLTGLSPSAAPV